MLDLKALLSKILSAIQKPPIAKVDFDVTLTSKATGGKTISFTPSVPSGYAILAGCRPIGMYVSGSPVVTITDMSSVVVNGTTASINFYLYNPQNFTGALAVAGTLLCYRVGGGYLTSKFSNIFSHLERWWKHVRRKETADKSAYCHQHDSRQYEQRVLGGDRYIVIDFCRSAGRCLEVYDRDDTVGIQTNRDYADGSKSRVDKPHSNVLLAFWYDTYCRLLLSEHNERRNNLFVRCKRLACKKSICVANSAISERGWRCA